MRRALSVLILRNSQGISIVRDSNDNPSFFGALSSSMIARGFLVCGWGRACTRV